MTHHQKIVFSGEGDQAPNIIPGDVVIVLEEKEHPRFKRTKQDLHYNAKIDLVTALTGGSFPIEHLDGRVLLVSILPGEVIKPGDIKQITGEGMPQYKRPYDKGNLLIQFELIFPSKNWTNSAQLKTLETLLPPRTIPSTPVNMSDMIEEVTLSEPDMSRRSNQEGSSRSAYQEDEEDGQGHGHPGVQCAQQ